MPTSRNPYDFIDAPAAPFDFGDAPTVDSIQPPKETLGRAFGVFLADSGLLDHDQVDPHGWRFFSEPASTTVTDDSGVQGADRPVPKRQKEQSPLQVFARKMEELNKSMPGPQGAGGKAAAYLLGGPVGVVAGAGAVASAALGTVGELISGAARDWIQPEEFDPDATLMEQGWGGVRNAAASLAEMPGAILQLPEAFIRNPDETIKGLITYAPHQAALVWHALNWTDRERQREALRELYQDPLGPVFAAAIVKGVGKASAATIRNFAEAAKLARWSTSAEANEIRAAMARDQKFKSDYESALDRGMESVLLREREAAGLQARQTPSPPPNVPTRSLTTTAETPPTGPITDPARMIPMMGPKGEVAGPTGGFFTREASRSSRIPPEQAVRGAFGGPEFSETATPLGAETRYFEGQFPPARIGSAPEGNYMDFIWRLRAEAKPTVSVGPPPPPKHQPFLRSGKFSEIPALDETKVKPGEPTLLESANPITAIPEELSLTEPTKAATDGWLKLQKKRGTRMVDILKTMGRRLESPSSQKLITALRDKSRRQHAHLGTLSEDFNELGLSLQRNQSVMAALKRKIKGVAQMTVPEFIKIPEARQLFVRMGSRLKDMGVQIVGKDGKLQPFELSEDFLTTGPYRWKADILQRIWDDVSGVGQQASIAAEEMGPTLSRQWYEGAASKIWEKSQFKFSDETRAAVEALIDPQKGMFKTPGQALKFLYEEAGAQLYRRHGVEHARLSNIFPEEFRETNPAKLIARYLNEVSQTMAEVEVFGPARKGLVDLLDEISKTAPDEFAMARDLSDVVMGVIDQTKPLSTLGVIAQRRYSKFMYGTKIGLGLAPIVQITQPLISFVPDAGVVRSIKGTFKAMSPEYRATLRRQGVIGPAAFRRMMGYGNEGISRFLPTTRFFDFANRVLDYTSAATGESFARDLYKIANKEASNPLMAKRVKWAQDKLKERFDIDYTKPLGEAEFMKMTHDYAHFTQLHPDATMEPRFFNMPQTRWLASLKRFTYRQTLLARDVIWKDLKRGNVFPLLRAAAGGQLGGEIMIEAKDKIREMLTGKHVFREGDAFWVTAANRYAIVSTFGTISDVGWITDDDPVKVWEGVTHSTEFTIVPVAISDVVRASKMFVEGGGRVVKATLGSTEQKKQNDAEELLRRQAEDFSTLLGSYGYYVSSQFQGEDRESDKNRAAYTKQLGRARKAYWSGDKDRALAIMKEWEQYKDLYPVKIGKNKKGTRYMSMNWRDISDLKYKDKYK